jgi:hypothetical protein
LRLPFELEGQLIHGRQVVNWRPDKNRYDNRSIAEVRPVAFKNMLRYWFRTFALGVLPVEAGAGVGGATFWRHHSLSKNTAGSMWIS